VGVGVAGTLTVGAASPGPFVAAFLVAAVAAVATVAAALGTGGGRAECRWWNGPQEAYARAFVRWSRVRDYDLPEAWVRRVALNLAAMNAKSLRRRSRALLRLGSPPHVPELSPEVIDLYDALRTLPLGQRQVIVLHHLAGLPVEEVARELRLAPGTVKSRLARGRAAIASALHPDRSEVT
jgi:RNA polymerase sigma-70 factor (ECF subfamily)